MFSLLSSDPVWPLQNAPMTLFVFQYFATKKLPNTKSSFLQPKNLPICATFPPTPPPKKKTTSRWVGCGHPSRPPHLHPKVLAPESRQRVESPCHYDHPKVFPALSSGMGLPSFRGEHERRVFLLKAMAMFSEDVYYCIISNEEC